MRERRPHRPIASATVSVAPTAPMVATTIGNLRGLRLPAEHLVRVGAARGAARTDANPELVPAAAVARPTARPATMTMTRSNPPTPSPAPRVRSQCGRTSPRRARRLLAASHGGTPVPRPIGDTPPTTSARTRAKRQDWSSRRRTKSCGPRSATHVPRRRWRHPAKRRKGRANGAVQPARQVRMTRMARPRQERRSVGAEAGGIVRARGRARPAVWHRRPAVGTRTRVARTMDPARRIGS